MLLSCARAGAAAPCILALSAAPAVSIDHLAHFSSGAVKQTAKRAFAFEAVFGGLVGARPDFNNRFVLGLERFRAPGFVSGAPAAEVAPALFAGTLGRLARSLTTSSLHCMLQHAVVVAAGSAFFETYFRNDHPKDPDSSLTSRLSSAVEVAFGGMCAALLYEYALALQGVVEGVLVDHTRGELMLWSRIKHASVVPPLAAMWDGVCAGLGYFLGLGAGVGLTLGRDLYNHPRESLAHRDFGGK
jgi:hypothetical protein